MVSQRRKASRSRESSVDFSALEEIFLCALVIAIPLVFWKAAFRVFVLPKVTLLVCGVWLLLAVRWLASRHSKQLRPLDRHLVFACGSFVLLVLLSTVFA